MHARLEAVEGMVGGVGEMTITMNHLPQSTPHDPAEDPPGSIDPLGTVTGAEQLAEVLFPGVTARMWRVRLLTFAACVAATADPRLTALLQTN
jgi:hypothetical protein